MMDLDHGTHRDSIGRLESVLVDAVLRNGVDRSAFWRAHLRELTMARQAAERQHARPVVRAGLERWEQRAATRERGVAFTAELARINAAHRTWLREQGAEAAVRSERRRRAPKPEQQWPVVARAPEG